MIDKVHENVGDFYLGKIRSTIGMSEEILELLDAEVLNAGIDMYLAGAKIYLLRSYQFRKLKEGDVIPFYILTLERKENSDSIILKSLDEDI